MRNITAIVGKEMRLYFVSPIVYVVAAVFLGITDFFFYVQTMYYANGSAQMMRFQQNLPQMNLHSFIFVPTLMNMSVILMLILPLLTMRLLAEEKKNRTMELLLTSPLSVTQILLGKFFAAVLVYLTLLALTLHLPIGLSLLSEVTWAPLGPAYLGLALMGGMFLAMGLFASALTENQIVAAVVSFGILIGFWLVGAAAPEAGTPAAEIVRYLSVSAHLDNMVKGLIDTRDVVYFATMTAVGLFLSHRVVDSHRWK